jgi:hypothetical protein
MNGVCGPLAAELSRKAGVQLADMDRFQKSGQKENCNTNAAQAFRSPTCNRLCHCLCSDAANADFGYIGGEGFILNRPVKRFPMASRHANAGRDADLPSSSGAVGAPC